MSDGVLTVRWVLCSGGDAVGGDDGINDGDSERVDAAAADAAVGVAGAVRKGSKDHAGQSQGKPTNRNGAPNNPASPHGCDFKGWCFPRKYAQPIARSPSNGRCPGFKFP